MTPKYRAGKAEDIELLYKCFVDNTDDINQEHYDIVKREWETLMQNPTTMTMIVEDADCADSFIAVGQAVFVTEKFAEFACQGLPFWINARLTEPLPDGSWPLMNYDEVARANATTGVIGVLCRWDVHRRFSPEVALKLRQEMQRWFEKFYRGYNYKEIWVEATGPGPKEEALRAGFHVIDDYQSYARQLPDDPEIHPCLLRLTRDEALLQPSSLASYSFAYTPPLARFTRRQKEILQLALDKVNDKEIAKRLHFGDSTINKEWLKIYEHAHERLPVEIPAREDRKRGPERRGPLLAYLENHLEELRPYDASAIKKNAS
jgi:hypothetical protein